MIKIDERVGKQFIPISSLILRDNKQIVWLVYGFD